MQLKYNTRKFPKVQDTRFQIYKDPLQMRNLRKISVKFYNTNNKDGKKQKTTFR